jgi:glycosyltransferase involved in cell wall biosynthesis
MKSTNIDVSVILPCYNEAPLFVQSVKEILRVLRLSRYSFEIIFVDDKSSDATAALIKKTCERVPSCRALYHPKNYGRGKTVVDGIKTAKGKVVGYIDIDLEVSPVYIPNMVKKILEDEADVVIGRRVYRTSMRSILREVLSRGYQWLSDMMIGTGGLDTETGYKFFDRKTIVPILKQTEHTGWFWDTEIMVYVKRRSMRIVEVPVLFVRRFDKKSSVRVVRDIIDYLVSLGRFRAHLAEKHSL